MKSFFRKIISFVLIIATLLTCVGCSKDEDKTDDGNNEKQKQVAVTSTNHIFEYTKTNKWFLYEGKTNYKICVPEKVSNEIKMAKDELTRIFEEATSCSIKTVSDTAKEHNSDYTYISLGDTNLYKTADLGIDKSTLGRDGSRIITKDRTIYIVGGQDIGVLYGVYDLLNILFNFETYYKDCYTLDKGVKNLELYDFNVTDIPDIAYREQRGILNTTASGINETMYTYRMRALDGYGELLLPIHLGDSKYNAWKVDHNCFYYFPKETYISSHPKFYASSGEQLCYSAHGDEAEFDTMTTLAAEKIEQSLVWYPYSEYPQYIGVEFGMNDLEGVSCTCETCTKIKQEHNNALSATIIRFLNAVGKKVNAWMELPENKDYKRDLQYTFLAYNNEMSIPPTTKTEDGKYVLNDDLIEEGVKIVPFCALNRFSASKSIYDSVNKDSYEYGVAWSTAFPGAWNWSYGCFFNDYLTFYDYYNFYADFYKYLYENKFSFNFTQSLDWQRGTNTGFGNLFYYVSYKLAWNTSLDMNTLIDNYFDAMYKEASEPMKQFFTNCRLWFNTQAIKYNWGNSINSSNVSGNKKYWSIGLIDGYMSLLNQAYNAIEVYKEDTEIYDSLRKHIDAEWLAPAIVLIKNFEDEVTEETYKQTKSKFKSICNEQGVTYIAEWTTIDSFLENL